MWKRVGKTMGFFFSGSQIAKLDEKNRFVLGQSFRYGLVDEGRLEFYLGLGAGGCLALYRKGDIEELARKFESRQYNAGYQKFFTLFFSTLHLTTCDKIGRINLPAHLKEAAKMEKEIVVAGVLGKIELWSKEIYDRNLLALLDGSDPEFDLAKLTEEAFALLDKAPPEEEHGGA